jgi:DNA methyltransferase 1-associated protein 1
VPRSIEDLKTRYYSVARQLLVGREGTADTIANNVLVKHPFSAVHERERKQGLELLFNRPPEQDAEEEGILQEAIKIEARRRAENTQRRAANAATAAPAAVAAPAPVTITEFANDVAVGTPPLFDGFARPAPPTAPAAAAEGTPAPRVVARSAHTRELIEAMIQAVQPAKTQKAVEGSMTELKLPDLPRAATRAVCGAYISLVREVIDLMELKKNLAASAAKRGRPSEDLDDGGGKRQKMGGKRGYDE